jgi:phage tail sheath gpL-like
MYAEITSGGTPANSNERLLLVGYRGTNGTASLNSPVLVPNKPYIEDTLFGPQSMLGSMVRIARRGAPFQEIWALPLGYPGGGTRSTATLDFTGLTLPVSTNTEAAVYLAGTRYAVTVTPTDTATTIANKMAGRIEEDTYGQANAVAAAGVVTLTSIAIGIESNDLNVSNSSDGPESVPTTEIAVTNFSGGTGVVDLTTALASLGDEEFAWVASGVNGDANIASFTSFFDETSGRWSPYSQKYGHVLMSRYSNLANLSTLGDGLNDPHLSVLGVHESFQSPSWDLSAAIMAQVALGLSDAPALSRPLQFTKLPGITGELIRNRFNLTERNTLLYDGISTIRYSNAGDVLIERLITTYKTDETGTSDATFLDIQTLAQSQYAIKYLRNKVVGRHGQDALADDNAIPINGVSRPRDIKTTLIAGYAELAALGVVENQELFEQNLVVERNAIDASRIDVSLPVDVVNQLRILAVQTIINLQFSS